MTYFIAECGQNHNGSMMLARKLIDMAAMPIIHEGQLLQGVDAVKFTKRDLDEEMTAELASKPYSGRNAFGPTYMEHRKALELSPDEHHELYLYAKDKGLDFVETTCSRGALDSILTRFYPDYLKVASRDIDNFPLLEVIACADIPIILSTGMASEFDIEEALRALTIEHFDVILLHCVSAYPIGYEDINLRKIKELKKFGFPVGYSDHTTGILAPALAVALGAEYVEKHITIDRSLPGTDQEGSLAPDGLYRCVRDVRNTEVALGYPDIGIHPLVVPTMAKLKRSLCFKRNMKAGDVIYLEDLCMLSPGNGLRWQYYPEIVYRKLVKDVKATQQVREDMVSKELAI